MNKIFIFETKIENKNIQIMKYNDIYILRNKDFKSLITVFQEIEPPFFAKKVGGGSIL